MVFEEKAENYFRSMSLLNVCLRSEAHKIFQFEYVFWLRVPYTVENHCPTMYHKAIDNRTYNTVPLNTVKKHP